MEKLSEWFQTCEYEILPNVPQLVRYYRINDAYMAEV